MNKRKQICFLIILILILFLINYQFFDSLLVNSLDEKETEVVERVIDGDTIVVEGKSVRLLGINAPERGEDFYEQAKEFLEMIILNKTVELKFSKEKYDKYNRKLAYLFYKEKNVNLELVDEGFANFYFPSGKDKYYDKFFRTWEKCIRMNKYLCEKSIDKCADCIELKSLDYRNEKIVFYNKCDFDCDLGGWEIKDEGRKNFVFENFVLNSGKEIKIITSEGKDSDDVLFWNRKDYVWTDSGDTLFLRDDGGKLVLYYSY